MKKMISALLFGSMLALSQGTWAHEEHNYQHREHYGWYGEHGRWHGGWGPHGHWRPCPGQPYMMCYYY